MAGGKEAGQNVPERGDGGAALTPTQLVINEQTIRKCEREVKVFQKG